MVSRSWKNENNQQFYASFSQAQMREYEKSLGLVDAPELDLIQDYLKNTDSVIELGAGEGRVVAGLLNRRYLKSIYAVERNPIFLKQLHAAYQGKSQVRIIQGDLLHQKTLPKAQVGLWLWAGIMEFSPQEQQKVLQDLERTIEKTLIVETPFLGSETNASVEEKNWLELHDAEKRVLHGYLPSQENICSYLSHTSWHLQEIIPYEQKVGKKRVLYVLKK